MVILKRRKEKRKERKRQKRAGIQKLMMSAASNSPKEGPFGLGLNRTPSNDVTILPSGNTATIS